jgi:hypothetical protein
METKHNSGLYSAAARFENVKKIKKVKLPPVTGRGGL